MSSDDEELPELSFSGGKEQHSKESDDDLNDDPGLQDEMDDLFGDEVDEEAEDKA
jgi:hypothetical protein